MKRIGLGLGIIVLISSFALLGCDNKSKKVETKEAVVESEENNDKEKVNNETEGEFVKNADYTYGDLKGKKYKYYEYQYSIDDVVVPYIKIESDDAKKTNEEIKKLYDELAKKVEDMLKNKEEPDTWYIISKYETTINDNVL